jgi:predicted O-linked N-acetylglucosamine transferase (SPINDLY family)
MQGKSALAELEQAAALMPIDAEAHSNLGAAYLQCGRPADAQRSCQRALALNPQLAQAHCNLGAALKDQGQLDQALAHYHRALALKPDYADTHSNLGSALLASGQPQAARGSFETALHYKPDLLTAHSNLLCIHNYLLDQPKPDLLAAAKRYGAFVQRRAQAYSTWLVQPDPQRRLRVGLVSADLRSHPVGYFLESVLAALVADPGVELVAYATRFQSDALTERLKTCCTGGWHEVFDVSDATLARRIHDDAIDILIDLAGHTAHNRLPVFAYKPAPVQVSWLGYFATTGVSQIDYVLADPWTLPASEEPWFTETIWRLPQTRLCFTPPMLDVPVSALPALAQGHITFGCFNSLAKFNPAVLALWAQVLKAVPGSRLLLKARELDADAARQGVQQMFAQVGIAPERLLLEGHAPRAEYLAAYQRVDMALDTFPFPGGTVTVESLWMGVPVLTLAGSSFLARQGVGLLMNAGLADWVASDSADYLARAVRHANTLDQLAALRQGLRQQVLASPVCDAPRFAGHLAQGLRGMWQHWCAARPALP